MSKRASPTVLGAFIVGGLLLIAVGLIIVGSRGLFAQKSKLILYFPGSVNGLEVGSPVKFKGVTIGQVSSIKISLSTADVVPYIPVVIEVDDNLVADTTGDPLDLSSPVVVRAMINKGIRASLEIESLLTGMLYVGLDVYPNAPPAVLRTPPGKYPEIPTVQTGLQKLAGSLPKVERILDSVESAANELNAMLKQIQAGRINDALVNALGDVQKLLRSPSLTNAFVSIEQMADEFRGTASSLRGDLAPLMKQFSNTATAADRTLAELDRVLVDTRRLLGDDSPMVSQLVTTLTEFQRMAVSLRQFADYLSRNPQAILTGRNLSNDFSPMSIYFKALFCGLAALVASGCFLLTPKKDPTRFYELTRLSDPPAAAQLSPTNTMVVTVRIAGYLQNNSVAQRVAPNQIAYLPFDQWAQPFGEGVDQTLQNDLEILTGWAVLQANQSYVTREAVRIDVQLNRFDVLPDHQVELAAFWRVRTAQSGAAVHQDSYDQTRSYSPDPSTLQPAVAMLNELLHELSRAIVADLPK